MIAVRWRRQNSQSTAQLELRALERMIKARCEQIDRWAQAALSRGDLASREDDFQLQAFAERRTKALEQLGASLGEPREARIGRLERLVEALECSWAYFRSKRSNVNRPADVREWAILVK